MEEETSNLEQVIKGLKIYSWLSEEERGCARGCFVSSSTPHQSMWPHTMRSLTLLNFHWSCIVVPWLFLTSFPARPLFLCWNVSRASAMAPTLAGLVGIWEGTRGGQDWFPIIGNPRTPWGEPKMVFKVKSSSLITNWSNESSIQRH